MAILTGQNDKLALSHGSRELEVSKILIHATVKRTIIPQTSTCVHFVTEAALQLGGQALFMKAMPPVLLTSDKLMSISPCSAGLPWPHWREAVVQCQYGHHHWQA